MATAQWELVAGRWVTSYGVRTFVVYSFVNGFGDTFYRQVCTITGLLVSGLAFETEEEAKYNAEFYIASLKRNGLGELS
jgi:hypothetical protein